MRAVTVDRAFPHTLEIVVVPERALAVVRNGREALGRVGAGPRDQLRQMPMPGSRSSGQRPSPTSPRATVVESENILLALQALRRLPRGLPERVDTARASYGEITVVLAGGMEIWFGGPHQLALKLAVAARVLGTMAAEDRAALDYLDVSVPEKGRRRLNSQLST